MRKLLIVQFLGKYNIANDNRFLEFLGLVFGAIDDQISYQDRTRLFLTMKDDFCGPNLIKGKI